MEWREICGTCRLYFFNDAFPQRDIQKFIPFSIFNEGLKCQENCYARDSEQKTLKIAMQRLFVQ